MEKSVTILVLFALLAIPFVSASISLQKQVVSDVAIKDANQSASFILNITNNGAADSFRIFSLSGMGVEPSASFDIGAGETKSVTISVFPQEGLMKQFNRVIFPITFTSTTSATTLEDSLVVDLQNLEGCFDVGTNSVNPDANSVELYFYNIKNAAFKDLSVELSSPFFKITNSYDIAPFEKKIITIQLNRDDYKKLVAGTYLLDANMKYKGASAKLQRSMTFLEKESVTTKDNTYGFLISDRVIGKTNDGNIPKAVSVSVEKNIITRLFTFASPSPTNVERDGFFVTYNWQQTVNPGETFTIDVKTNWLFPLLLILVVAVIAFFVKRYTQTDLVMNKRASFVHAKGGAFGLKVTVTVTAKNFIENVRVTDRLPPMTRIIENTFGGIMPHKIDEKSGRVEWVFNHLDAGEQRTFSYVIYSRVGVVGKYALPRAFAMFSKGGEIHESESNQVFYIAEPVKRVEEE